MELSLSQLQALDLLLMAVHLGVIGINLLGWMFPMFRVIQRWVLGLTTLSWLGLGPWFGWGYCFLTDWHWDIKRALGEGQLPPSYIQYILRNRLGFSFSDFWVDVATGTVFGLLVIITVTQVVMERRRGS
jgi:hypothetical protein